MFTVNLQAEHKDANNVVMSLVNSLSSDISISLSKLIHLSTYIDLASKYAEPNTVINANDIVLQAINYDSDDNNNYWAILTNDFAFMDVAIPLIADLDDDKIYDSFSLIESKVLKSLKEYLN